jgi:hypothetical protein
MGYQPLPSKPKQQETQPKDEHPPLQGYGVSMEGWSGVPMGGQSNRALLALMRSIEERFENDLSLPDFDRRLITLE